jgi:outer membrane protein OmpA-like peptidoglycan-associated protein
MTLRKLASAAVLLAGLAGARAGAQELQKFKIVDLVFRVESVAGQVEDLKVKETETEVRIDLAADVLFDFDKADIKAAAADTLKQVARVIREKARGSVRIEGYTDAKGTEAYNQVLSERRAASVKRWLVEKDGLKDIHFLTSGYGAKSPVAPNTKPDGSDDPEGRQKNRRVVIVMSKA